MKNSLFFRVFFVFFSVVLAVLVEHRDARVQMERVFAVWWTSCVAFFRARHTDLLAAVIFVTFNPVMDGKTAVNNDRAAYIRFGRFYSCARNGS